MTFNDIIDEVRGLIQETDPLNTHVSDNLMIQWGNACTLQLYSLIGTYPKTKATGIVTAADITLPTTMLKLDYAAYKEANGTIHVLQTGDFSNFVRVNPAWESTPAGMPEQLIRMGDTDWMMYPNPSAQYQGLETTLMGTILPTPATLSTETPPISIVLHPCYSHYIAWKAWLLLNNADKAKEEWGLYDGLRKLNTRTATSTTGSQQCFKMSA